MNREIKFRAWHKAEQVMGEVTTLTDKGAFVVGVKPAPDQFIAGRGQIVISPTDGRFCKLDEIELMQFTGLRDKNGVEIYENDVVDSLADMDEPYYRKVIWGKNCGLEFFPLTGFTLCGSNEYHFRVIGNVFQNPELL